MELDGTGRILHSFFHAGFYEMGVDSVFERSRCQSGTPNRPSAPKELQDSSLAPALGALWERFVKR